MKYYAVSVAIGLALLYVLLAIVGAFVNTLINLNFEWLSVFNAGVGLLTVIAVCAVILTIDGITKLLRK